MRRKPSSITFFLTLIICSLLFCGRAVFASDTVEESEEVPTSSGKWTMQSFVDEFGDPTDEKYIRTIVNGEFSNSATTGSNLDVIVFAVPGQMFSFRLLEYGRNVATYTSRDNLLLKYKLGDKIYEQELQGEPLNGDLYLTKADASRTFSTLTRSLNSQTEIRCLIYIGNSKYSFTIPSDGFTDMCNAMSYEDAVKMMNSKNYTGAIEAFKALDGFLDSDILAEECQTKVNEIKYKEASRKMKRGDYTEAEKLFKELKGFQDSDALLEECKWQLDDQEYKKAIEMMDAGQYEDAVKVLEGLGDHLDSVKLIEECRKEIETQLQPQYDRAIALISQEKYLAARVTFLALGDYKDSAEKAKELEDHYPAATLKKGDKLEFGHYFLGSVTAKEPIVWNVLDVQADAVLVISEKILDCRQYNDQRTETTWENCSLRPWLNNEFIQTAFSEEEQSAIMLSEVKADPNPEYSVDPGNDTMDRIFLPSAEEVMKYYPNPQDRLCKPTVFATTKGASPDENGNAGWGLRTPGNTQIAISFVARNSGYILGIGDFEVQLKNAKYGTYIDVEGFSIRPMMWISISRMCGVFLAEDQAR